MPGTPDLRPVSRGMVEVLIVTERARLSIRELSERGGPQSRFKSSPPPGPSPPRGRPPSLGCGFGASWFLKTSFGDPGPRSLGPQEFGFS